jgi:VWFA-related protein
MEKPTHRPALLAILTAFVTCSSWLFVAATQAPAGAQPAFTETVDVNLVNVEVWVTDRQGNPVTGLEIDDFEVREDGKPVPLANFLEVREPRVVAPPSAEALRSAGDDPAAQEHVEVSHDAPSEMEQPQASGWLALYFDELFSEPAGRKQLLEDLRTVLEQRLVPAERTVILRQDKGLQVEANFGSSRDQLEAALQRLETPSAQGAQTWADERNALRDLQQEWERELLIATNTNRDPCTFFPRKAFSLIQVHINSSRGRIAETLDHLATSAGILAGFPGPKTLIYVSDGLALAPGRDLVSFVKSLCPGQQDDSRLDYLDGMGDSFRHLSRQANASRVTMYAIQASGLRSNLSATSAETRGVNRTIQSLSRYNSESRIQQREGMSYLADQTGGRAVFNQGSFVDTLEQIASDMKGYYSLAYAPLHGGDGLEHTIDVEVRGEKLRVRHRPGYRDKGPDQRLVERLQSALHLNLVDNPLQVSLGAGEIELGKKEKLTLPLHVRIPVDQITFLPGAGGAKAQVQVLVMTRDEAGAKTSFKRESYRLDRPKGDAEGLTLSLVVDLELEVGVHYIAIAVRDEATQIASVVATGVDLKRPPAAASKKRP